MKVCQLPFFLKPFYPSSSPFLYRKASVQGKYIQFLRNAIVLISKVDLSTKYKRGVA